jgi:hypothetical protein
MREALGDSSTLFSFLKNEKFGRSLPAGELHRQTINAEVVSVLLEVRSNGSIVYDEADPSVRTCVENGWLQTNVMEDGQLVCFFPSKVHAR